LAASDIIDWVQAGTLLLAATRLGVKLAGTLADPPPGPSDEAAGG